jgi:O-antigen ligase
VAFAGLLALPVLPSSYWQRVASITNENLDETGSREARSVLLRESFDAFVAHPFTGVGAGQFKNYNPEGREEAWRESHNVVLQVAAELGVAGLAVFFYLVIRAFLAPLQARRLLRAAAPGRSPGGAPVEPVDEAEYEMLSLYTAVATAALAGWFFCALFASVAYHWTFYYLLALAVAPRDYLLARATAARSARRAVAARTVTAVGAHA